MTYQRISKKLKQKIFPENFNFLYCCILHLKNLILILNIVGTKKDISKTSRHIINNNKTPCQLYLENY